MARDTERFLSLVELSVRREALKKLVFSKPLSPDGARKITGRLCFLRSRRVLVLEFSLSGDTVAQRNLSEDTIADGIRPYLDAFGQVNLITTAGDAELRRSKSGTVTLLGASRPERALSADTPTFVSAVEELHRRKNHLFTGEEPFLRALGISDAGGRIHDKMQGKFRQICRFTEHLSDVYGHLPAEGVLTVYDLCCGKSYLSFAVYHYLTAVRGRTVDMLCMDLKADVIRSCDALARELGYAGMHFVTGDITTLPSHTRPDLVMSLHACDTATDIVLDTAIRLEAAVILSTPCCHRYLTDRLSSPSLSFVSAYPHLKNKLCEVLTDAIRLARLRKHGYRVSAPELTDPENTPKNTLLRAVRTGHIPEGAEAEYQDILRFVLGDGADTYLEELPSARRTIE